MAITRGSSCCCNAASVLALASVLAMAAMLSSSALVTSAARAGLEHKATESETENLKGRGLEKVGDGSIAAPQPRVAEVSARQIPTGPDPIHHNRAPIRHSP